MLKSVRWAGHAARMGVVERRVECRVLVGKPEGKTLGRPTRRWEDNIKINLKEVAWGLGLHWSGSG